MTLLPLPLVADRLGISLSLVQKLARAAEYAAALRAGKLSRDDVPVSLERYLNCGFPAPLRIGRSVRRIREDELERWLKAAA